MTWGDLPTMSKAIYASTAYAGDDFTTGTQFGAALGGAAIGAINQLNTAPRHFDVGANQAFILAKAAAQQHKGPQVMNQSRRLVQVFIADPDQNVPLEKSLLFTGSQKLTDATDQELFFEIDMKSILEAHNTYRATVINKKVKERTEFLEPVKIRDLKMVVVDVATF